MAIPRNNLTKMVELIVANKTKNRLEDFRRYTLELEGKFTADKNRLMQNFNESITDLSDEEIIEIEEYYADDYQHIEEVQVSLYRKSTLVSLYSFLEHSLNDLCGYQYRRYEFAVEVTDLRGEGIVRARDYLIKLIKVDFSLLNDEWRYLMEFNKIRNCIVHSDGDINQSRSKKSLHEIVNSREGLELQHEKFIKISREYVDFIITKIEVFMAKLYSQVFQAPLT